MAGLCVGVVLREEDQREGGSRVGLGGEGGWGWCQGGPSPPLWVSLAERLERKSPSGWMYRQDPSSLSAGLSALPLGSHGAWD